ncbi:MAG TPA: helix-turn-helix domain-containing protein [Solirubrobacterales bacterium]|jgi:AcrR family transcriptional regulator|nr:helix-turn-helix domain-containing protein [Solirubrobacterales bacterium]
MQRRGSSPSAPSRPALGRREQDALATRQALIDAGRQLFSARGYARVATEEIVERAKVTRGALYHHFRDKRDLFRAVFESVEQDLIGRIAASMDGVTDSWDVLRTGLRAMLDACNEPAVKQIGLVDAPAVLGWREWREIDERYGLGLLRAALGAAMDAGVLRRVPVDALAYVMLGALTEAAFVVANADDPATARRETEAALIGMLEGMRAKPAA